ncbi:hypothetical protein J7444_03955 [Labrenzia sp. R4_1]|jgi:hypothetical protein|uniref:hypothetical protein n=1 Tax=unclassified Labrenzia TaxID=2648686 RepID=UPI001063B0D0|nr:MULTISPECIES: hypothetical protein [unclassified Labrenzia]MBO9417870.1 hypothetical protein [Labrenzia sp. R4_2]MBO9423858.1 hypothetical protein [Labrenzia sp. R4_1]
MRDAAVSHFWLDVTNDYSARIDCTDPIDHRTPHREGHFPVLLFSASDTWQMLDYAAFLRA